MYVYVAKLYIFVNRLFVVVQSNYVGVATGKFHSFYFTLNKLVVFVYGFGVGGGQALCGAEFFERRSLDCYRKGVVVLGMAFVHIAERASAKPVFLVVLVGSNPFHVVFLLFCALLFRCEIKS